MTDAPMKTLDRSGFHGLDRHQHPGRVRRNRHLYQVYALVAGHNIETLASQILEFRPQVAVVATSEGLARLSDRLHAAGLPRAEWPELLWGDAARVEAVTAPPKWIP